MNVQEQIQNYLDSLQASKRTDLSALKEHIQRMMPSCKLWFLDGRDEQGKIVSNPNIGFGLRTIQYADGKTRDFYQIGISANTTGISVYIMGIADKNYLPETYGKSIGKASVTGYCVKFKTLNDIHMESLESAIRVGFQSAH